MARYYEQHIIYIPNTFTPDNDGINDVFKPVTSVKDFISYEFLIFNRWGELIFLTKDPEVSWDGTYNGKKCQIDTYVWKLNYTFPDDVIINAKFGHVNLLR